MWKVRAIIKQSQTCINMRFLSPSFWFRSWENTKVKGLQSKLVSFCETCISEFVDFSKGKWRKK